MSNFILLYQSLNEGMLTLTVWWLHNCLLEARNLGRKIKSWKVYCVTLLQCSHGEKSLYYNIVGPKAMSTFSTAHEKGNSKIDMLNNQFMLKNYWYIWVSHFMLPNLLHHLSMSLLLFSSSCAFVKLTYTEEVVRL